PWGAYLDSTLDRLGDAAVFGGLVLWFLGAGDRPLDGWHWAAWSPASSSPTPRLVPRRAGGAARGGSPRAPAAWWRSWSPPASPACSCPRGCSPWCSRPCCWLPW